MLHRDRISSLLRARQRQHLFDHAPHSAAFVQNGFHRFVLCVGQGSIRHQAFGICQNHRHRRAQLVRCIRCEAPLAAEGILQRCKHPVQRARQFAQFVRRLLLRNAPRQIAVRNSTSERRARENSPSRTGRESNDVISSPLGSQLAAVFLHRARSARNLAFRFHRRRYPRRSPPGQGAF